MDTKPWWKSRTLLLAVAQGIVGILIALKTANPILADAGWVAFAKAALDFYLRMNTTKPIN